MRKRTLINVWEKATGTYLKHKQKTRQNWKRKERHFDWNSLIKQKWDALKVFWEAETNQLVKRRGKQRTRIKCQWILVNG